MGGVVPSPEGKSETAERCYEEHPRIYPEHQLRPAHQRCQTGQLQPQDVYPRAVERHQPDSAAPVAAALHPSGFTTLPQGYLQCLESYGPSHRVPHRPDIGNRPARRASTSHLAAVQHGADEGQGRPCRALFRPVPKHDGDGGDRTPSGLGVGESARN